METEQTIDSSVKQALPVSADRPREAAEEGCVERDAGEGGEHGDAVEHPEGLPGLGLGAVVRPLVVHDGQHGHLLRRREEVVEEVDAQDGAEHHGVEVEEGERAWTRNDCSIRKA